MGLFSGVLTLPLAPVRGVVWIAEQVHEQVRRQTEDPRVLRQRLEEVETALARGEISEEEGRRQQEELVRRLMESGPPMGGLEV